MSLGKRTAAIASPTTCQRPLSYEQQEGQGAVSQAGKFGGYCHLLLATIGFEFG